MIVVRLKMDKECNMIETARKEVDNAFSQLDPPFNKKTDEIKLVECVQDSEWIKLAYEVIRNVKRAKSKENLSPYREIGITMQVGRNS